MNHGHKTIDINMSFPPLKKIACSDKQHTTTSQRAVPFDTNIKKVINFDPWLPTNYIICWCMQPYFLMNLYYDARLPVWDVSRSFNTICAAW